MAVASASMRAFVLMVHGINGSADDFVEYERAVLRLFPAGTVVLRSEANTNASRTGIVRMSEQLVREVVQAAERFPDDGTKYAFVVLGHSLGGVVMRHAVRALAEHPLTSPTATTSRLRWASFVTLSSPHLGSVRPDGGVARAFWRSMVHWIAASWYGGAGEELLHVPGLPHHAEGKEAGAPAVAPARVLAAAMEPAEADGIGAEPTTLTAPAVSLLMEISDPDGPYASALKHFPALTSAGAVARDLSVPYCSSLMDPTDPLREPQLAEAASRMAHGSWGVLWAMGNFTEQQAALVRDRLISSASALDLQSQRDLSQLTDREREWCADATGTGRLLVDARGEVAFHPLMLKRVSQVPCAAADALHLLCSRAPQLPWRRIAFHVSVSPMEALFVHVFPVCKFQPPWLRAASEDFVQIMTRLMLADSEQATASVAE